MIAAIGIHNRQKTTQGIRPNHHKSLLTLGILVFAYQRMWIKQDQPGILKIYAVLATS